MLRSILILNQLVNTFKIVVLAVLLILVLLAGCKKEETETDPDPIFIEYTVQDVSEYGKQDGAIDISISGGIPPYAYLWSTGDTTEDLNNLASGSYIITVTDVENSIVSDTIIVTEPEPAPLELTLEVYNVTVHGGNNGSIDLTVTGGALPYVYNWSNGSLTEDLNNLSAGTYIITVTDKLNTQIQIAQLFQSQILMNSSSPILCMTSQNMVAVTDQLI